MLHPPNNQIKKYNNTKQNAPQSTFRLRGYFTFRPHWWAIFKHLPLFLKLMHFSKHIPQKNPYSKKVKIFLDLRLKNSSIRYGNTHSIRINRNPLLLVARTDLTMQFVKKKPHCLNLGQCGFSFPYFDTLISTS